MNEDATAVKLRQEELEDLVLGPRINYERGTTKVTGRLRVNTCLCFCRSGTFAQHSRGREPLKARIGKILFCLALALFSLRAFCQNTAELRGVVTDVAGAPVVSAFVVVQSAEASVLQAATTNEAGLFEFPALPVGDYRVQVKMEGFQTIEVRDVRISIGRVVNLKLSMKPGQGVAEQTYGGASGVVDMGDTQVGMVMGESIISALPLKSRDAFELLQLQPGVQSTVGADLFYGGDFPGVVSVNGGRARSNNYNVNGAYSSDQFVNAPAIQPSPDTIREFRVISHNYAAELGRNSGSILNVITKSGADRLHGSAFEYLRNDLLNARGYFDPERAAFKQSQFGATIGGPIQKGKTFYFLSYEGRRLRRAISSDALTVPTGLERGGDFSEGDAFSGSISDQAVADALNGRAGCSTAVALAGGVPIAVGASYAAVFPGNIIPSACFDRTAADLLNQFVPTANVGTDQYRGTAGASGRFDQMTVRLDRNITNAQRFNLYYYGGDGTAADPFSRFQGSGADVPGFGAETRQRFQQAVLTHSWSVNAKMTNELRFSYFRQGQSRLMSPARTDLVQNSCASVPASECFSDPVKPQLGISPGYGAEREGVPFIALAGGFSIGNNPNGTFAQTGNVYSLYEVFSRIAGKHSLRFGGELRNQRLDQTYFYAINGDIEFSSGGPNDVGFNNLIPNYLLGLPSTYVQGSGNTENVRTTQFALFGQDSWKLRPSVTLNYGLRWEMNTPQADAGKRIQAFRPGQATSVYGCQLDDSNPLAEEFGTDCSPTGLARSFFPMGLVFPGDKNVPAGLTNGYYKSFAPRIGLAWSPSWNDGILAKLTGGPGRTSVSLGWGLFYDSNEQLVLSSFSAQPPFGGSTFLTNPFFNTPFLSQDGTVKPNPFQGFLNPEPGSAVDFSLFRPILLYGNFPEKSRSQYAAHYHLSIQREIAKDTLFQFGYVGSQGHRLLATIDQNYGNAQTCLDLNQILGPDSCGEFDADSAFFIPKGTIPAGVTLHLPYGSVASITGPNPNPISLVGLRRYSSPLCEPTTGLGCPSDGVPVFSSIFGIEPVANSAYNAFQASVTRRAGTVEFVAAYTFSKSLDSASSVENLLNPLTPSRSLSLFDARHRFVISYRWQLPTWHTGNWSTHLFNGWALSGIVTMQSGFPIRITSSSDRELMGSPNFESPGQPDMVASFKRLDPRTSGGYYFDPDSFVESGLGQIGNSPRTICCGPGITNFDLGLHKGFRVSEGKKLEFRTEIFNVFNHTQFMNPDGNITNGDSFGLVRRARDPRLIQLALRLSF